MSRPAFIPGLLLLSALLSTGCAGPVRQPPPRVHVGSAGDSAALVFYPMETAAILGHFAPGPELARLDRELALRSPAPLLATGQWPQHRRPSITEQRRIHIPERDGTYLFFLPERPVPHFWPHPW